MPLEIVQTDDALHQFSASLLRIPTRAITTIPRDENLESTEARREVKAPAHPQGRPQQKGGSGKAVTTTTTMDFGGNWILGNNKGVYLRATNDSFVANDETEDEVSELETMTFPFAKAAKQQSDDEHAEEEDGEKEDGDENDDNDVEYEDSQDDDGAEEYDEAKMLRERAARDRVNDELAWRFFAGSIDRARTEAILG